MKDPLLEFVMRTMFWSSIPIGIVMFYRGLFPTYPEDSQWYAHMRYGGLFWGPVFAIGFPAAILVGRYLMKYADKKLRDDE